MKINILTLYYIIIILKISECSTIINENKFTKIETSPKKYSIYSFTENKNKYEYLNIQLFLCEKNDENSHFSILNENNLIYETDIISSRQLIIPIKGQINLKLNITSRGIYLNYQYININKKIESQGLIKTVNIISNNIEINLSPVIINSSTMYELFSLNKNITEQCDILEYTIKNQSIKNKKINQTYENFNLTFENISIKDKYIFIKGEGIDELSYVYLYNIVEIKSNDIIFWYMLVIALICVIIVIILVILKKKEMIYKNNNEGLLF